MDALQALWIIQPSNSCPCSVSGSWLNQICGAYLLNVDLKTMPSNPVGRQLLLLQGALITLWLNGSKSTRSSERCYSHWRVDLIVAIFQQIMRRSPKDSVRRTVLSVRSAKHNGHRPKTCLKPTCCIRRIRHVLRLEDPLKDPLDGCSVDSPLAVQQSDP